MNFKRIALLLVLVFLVALPCCKKKSEPAKSTAAVAVPTPPAVEPGKADAQRTAAPLGTTDHDVADAAAVPPRPFSHLDPNVYTYISPLGVPMGPPTPPIGETEQISAGQLVDWTELPVQEQDGGYVPHQFKTPLDAALDLNALNNRGELLIQLLIEGDRETILKKFLPPEYVYNEFLKAQGVEDTTDAFQALKDRLNAQLDELAAVTAKYVGPVGRKDKFAGILMDGWARLTKWRFAYEAKEGSRREGCILFIMAENAWRVLDMKCLEKFWEQ